MKNIVLTRIDDRLIHGQVCTNWLKLTNGNVVLIVDEKLPNDMLMTRVLLAAAPRGVECIVKNVSDSIEFLQGDAKPGENVVILVKYPEPLEGLIDAGIPIDTIILGGMGMRPGRSTFIRNVAATPDEVECFKRILNKGVEIFYQMLPRDPQIDVSKEV